MISILLYYMDDTVVGGARKPLPGAGKAVVFSGWFPKEGAEMTDPLSADLMARLRARAKDPTGRSDTSAMAANSASMEEMIDSTPKSDDPAVREYLQGMNTPFAGMISNMVTGGGSQAKGLFGMLGGLLGGKQTFASMGGQTFSLGGKTEPRPAPPPCSESEVQAAEVELGFAVPQALRQFYLEVADGGVGRVTASSV